MANHDLDRVVDKRLKELEPVIEATMHRFLGVSITELSDDISKKLRVNPILAFDIDSSLKYKKAKKLFKSWFLHRLLEKKYGNISEAARIANVDRRSVHRIVKNSKINVETIRKHMFKPDYYKTDALSSIIGDALEKYREVIHPAKLELVYKNVSEISKDILKELPEEEITLREAEKEFERQFLTRALLQHNRNIKETAEKLGLRYETLIRKMRKLGIE